MTGGNQSIPENFNSCYRDEMDVAECPDKYTEHDISEDVRSRMMDYKQKLRGYGLVPKWNCDREIYELYKLDNDEKNRQME